MIKRIFLSILSVVTAASLLVGCSFIQHDYDRDYRQVAAHIESYTIENSVVNDDGQIEKKTYEAPEKDIYKLDLVDYVYANRSSLEQSFSTSEQLYKYSIEMLVNTELVINEVQALIDAGIVEWGIEDENLVKQRVYASIDNTLISLQNQILASNDKEQITTSGDTDVSTETTFPVKPEPEYDFADDDDTAEVEPWEPSKSKYPGLTNPDPDKRSLERAALRDFITLIQDRVKDDFRVTEEDKRLFEEDDRKIAEVTDTKGVEYVYGILGDTHYLYYITGKNYERSQKIAALQQYLTDSSDVSDDEVVREYTKTLNAQRSEYTADPSAFASALTGGSTTILYYPNTDYFYVKHILLPFSDEQKSELNAYKARINVTEDDIEEFRARLADGIVCYPHVAGENDMSRPMSVDEVIGNIKKIMLPLEANTEAADRAFDDLVYEYGTDDGAFGNTTGYAVKYKLADGESETYMQEFADAARYMRDNLEVGQVYYEKVITDYGVHIMYFASTTRVGAVSLYDYTTPGKTETYFDVIKAPIVSARESAAYTDWENQKLAYNLKEHATLFEDRYKNLWGA